MRARHSGPRDFRRQWEDPNRNGELAMEHRIALKRADDLLMAFVQSQEIPGGGTTGTATDHGVKTAQFHIGIHKTLVEYFEGVDG
jgi:hypothetical protein